jgi:Fur family transcriptional regulator, ferric uptake regulator
VIVLLYLAYLTGLKAGKGIALVGPPQDYRLTNDAARSRLRIDTKYQRNTMSKKQINELLVANGHRLTRGRRAVVEAALAGDDLFTIADVQRRVPRIGRATVFRTIKLLVDLDLLCRVRLEDGSLRYRLRQAADHHHHLVCTGCGSVEDFPECDLDAVSETLAGRTKYEIQGHRLELYGLCPACQVGSV